MRASNYRNNRIFTLKCIGQNLTLVSIKLKPSDNKISTSDRKIIEKAERQLMQDRVRGINRIIEDSDNNRDKNKNRLASIVTSTDIDRCGKFIDKVREERCNRVKARQVRMFHILLSKNIQINDKGNIPNRSRQGVNTSRQGHSSNRLDNGNQADNNYKNKWVINFSKTNLTEAQKAVLAKGHNYSITPNHLPNVEYITAVESTCPKLKEDDAMELRLDINLLLRKAKNTQTQPNQTGNNRISPTQKGQGQVNLNSRQVCSHGCDGQGGLH